jgi:hypothetical protein
VISFTPRPLYLQGKSPWYPLDRRLGEPQSRSERGREEKNSQPLLAFKPPIIQPVAQRHTAEISRLLREGAVNCDTEISIRIFTFSLKGAFSLLLVNKVLHNIIEEGFIFLCFLLLLTIDFLC